MKDFPDFLKRLDPDVYLSANYCVLDVETSNEDYGSALTKSNDLILGSVFGKHKGGWGLRTYWGERRAKLVEKVRKVHFIVAHNAKFELQWLARLGMPPGSVLVFDTMVAEYVLQGNRRVPLDLDSVCSRYGIRGKHSIVADWIANGVDPTLIPIKRLQEYCENDVEITHALFRAQLPHLAERGLLPVFFTRCLTTLVLAEIESRGMVLDHGKVDTEFRKESRLARAVLQELSGLTGGINPQSPKQVGEFLYGTLGFAELSSYDGTPKRTPTGSPCTDEDTISQLCAETPEQQRFSECFLRYIPIKKRLQTLTKLQQCVECDGGTLFAQYNQCVTATHRLSSSGRKYKVQFQNIDRDFKKLFKARTEGWSIGDADAPQLEWKVAAHEGDDPQAKADIRDHFDVHRFTASIIYKKPFEKVTKTERTEAKPHCFPIEETSLLTPQGFKRLEEFKVGDSIVAYDFDNRKLVNSYVEAVTKPHLAEIWSLSTKQNWEVRSTYDHRWYGEKRIDRGINRIYEPCIFTTEDINKQHRITTAAKYVGGTNKISPDDAARLAWLWSDGSEIWSPELPGTTQGKRRHCNARIIQKKEEGITEIDRLFGNIKKLYGSSGCYYWHISSSKVRELYISGKLNIDFPDYSNFILSLNPESRAAWLKAIKIAEGTQRPGGEWRIAQNSGSLAEAIKLAGYLEGHDIRVTYTMLYTGKLHEQITLRCRNYVNGTRIQKINLGERLVSCVKTPHGTVVIKQGDNICISGNTFKPVFGGKSGTNDERRYYQAFQKKYHVLYDNQKQWCLDVLLHKQYRASSGLIFYWPTCTMYDSGYIKHSTEIFNYKIQSFATADIIPITLVYMWYRLRAADMATFITNTVHDSIVSEVHPEEVGKYAEITKLAFTSDVFNYLSKVYNVKFSTSLGVAYNLASHWGEGKDEEFESLSAI